MHAAATTRIQMGTGFQPVLGRQDACPTPEHWRQLGECGCPADGVSCKAVPDRRVMSERSWLEGCSDPLST